MQEVSGKRSSVLAGVVVCVARKLADQAAKYETIVSSLGGQVARELGPTVTHFVFEVSGNRITTWPCTLRWSFSKIFAVVLFKSSVPEA